MTPLETILITTPEAVRLEEMQEEIKFMRRGIRALVRARVPLDDFIAEVRRQYVAVAIDEAGGNQSHAALMIDAHRNTVWRNAPPKTPRKPPQGATAVPGSKWRKA